MTTEPYWQEEPYDDEGEGEAVPETFFPLRGIAEKLCALLVVDLLLFAAQMFMDFWLMRVAQDTIAGRQFLRRDLDLFDPLSTILALVHLVIRLIVALTFIGWLFRAYRNVPALGSGDTRYAPGWAILAFFVPILNLFRPYQILCEAWEAGEPYVEGDETERVDRRQRPALLGWWALWLVAGALSQLTFRMVLWEQAMRNPEQALFETRMGLVAACIAIVCDLLTVLLVRRLTNRQERRERALIEAEERWDADAASDLAPSADLDPEHTSD